MPSPPSIRHGAIVPKSGFRWLRNEGDDEADIWVASEPPNDWPGTEYRYHADGEGDRSESFVSDTHFLAASIWECLQVHSDEKTQFGPLISAPDLYLEFASKRPTPPMIAEWAGKYGLLKYPPRSVFLEPDEAPHLLPYFDFGPGQNSTLGLYLEPAGEWLRTCALMALQLRTWSGLQATGDAQKMSEYLDDAYNYAMGGSLTYQVKMEPDSGEVHSEILAASLGSLLDVQWGMSIAAIVDHRQCSECATWFAVHPGAGRPEKLYCSDACRMRAYRKRKAVSQTGMPKKRK